MIKYVHLFFILCVALAGCTVTPVLMPTEEGYKSVLDSWLGRDKESLYQVWGAPMNDYWRNNTNYIVYMKQTVATTAQGATINRMPRIVNERAFYEKPQGLVSRSCTTIFKLEKEEIVSWWFEGNDCVALP